MKTLFRAVIFYLFVVPGATASLQSDQFAATGFTTKNVIGSSLQTFDSSTRSLKSLLSSASLTKKAIDALSHAELSKTKKVGYIYILTLFTGSSLESQKLSIYIDSSGNGYFQHGKKPVVYFYSAELGDALKAHPKKTEQGTAATPSRHALLSHDRFSYPPTFHQFSGVN